MELPALTGPAIEAELTRINTEKAAILRQQDEASALISVIERAATNPNVDIDKMERLLQMQERVMAQQAKTAFAADFALMQTEMPTITERGEIVVNGQTRSKYAKFEDINEAIKPVMQRYGFAVSFKVKTEGQQITVTGILMHRMGHQEETSMVLPADKSGSKNSVQELGSSISYGQRYVLKALLNISSRGEDTDGVVYVSEEQALTLHTLLTDTKADKAGFLRYIGATSIEQIPARKYDDAVKALEMKRRALEKK